MDTAWNVHEGTICHLELVIPQFPTSRVSPYTLSCSSRFLRALQQNREQLRLLYLLNFIQTEIYSEKYSRSCLWLVERFLSRIELL